MSDTEEKTTDQEQKASGKADAENEKQKTQPWTPWDALRHDPNQFSAVPFTEI